MDTEKTFAEVSAKLAEIQTRQTVAVLRARLNALDIVVKNLSRDGVTEHYGNTPVGAIYAEIVETYAAKANDLRLLICQLSTD